MGERGSIARHDYAELGDGNSGNGRRNGGSGGGGKQEFVLLATVEAMMERLPDFSPGSAKVILTLS